jgi:hypothetical protein
MTIYFYINIFLITLVSLLINKIILASSTQPNTVSLVSTDQYLRHYWPIDNGSMKDVISSADMTQGNLTSFTMDRFGNLNSALALNGGYTRVPSGVYFDSIEFTISAWVYPSNVGLNSRIIDFGNGRTANNIILSLSSGNLKPYFQIFSRSNLVFTATSSKPLTENRWQFLTATLNGTNATVYLNGTLVAESNTQNYTRPFNLSRSNCYVGKSNWPSDRYSSSYLDDLRFYNKSLTQEEIIDLMDYVIQSETGLFSTNYIICFFK